MLSVPVPVPSVYKDRQLVYTGLGGIGDKKPLMGHNGMGLRLELSVEIYVEASADARHLKIECPVYILLGKNDAGPVDTDLVGIGIRGMEEQLIADGLLSPLCYLIQFLGIVVKEILGQTEGYGLPCGRYIDDIPFGIIEGTGFKSEGDLALGFCKEELPTRKLPLIGGFYGTEFGKLPFTIYGIK